jgi:periplasmic divalent cation tolerance protein
MAADARLVLTTEANAELATALAELILEQRLAACIALKPVQSLYRWQGTIERSQEMQLLIKTHARCLPALEALVRKKHSYDLPQWLHWPAEASADYAAWLAENCSLS